MYNCMAQVWKWYDMTYGPAMGNIWNLYGILHAISKPIRVNSIHQ